MSVKYVEKRVRFGEVDEKLVPGVMLVMEDDRGVVQAVDFLCPCGCGSECYTPIVTPERPRPANRPIWDYEPGPTIRPSIRYTGGCRAHFNLVDGEAVMCTDSGK